MSGTRRDLLRLAPGLAGLLLLPSPRVLAAADVPVAVIVNKDNPAAVDIAFVRRVYLGTAKGWPDGSPVFALDQPEDTAVRQSFSTGILLKSLANVRAIWSQNIFTGRGMPPKLATADAEMKRIVSQNRNAIGYVHAASVDDTVRVIAP